MKLSIDYMRKSIKDNQMDYVTIKSINQMDYNKINLIIGLCTGFAPNYDDIYNLVESYNNELENQNGL